MAEPGDPTAPEDPIVRPPDGEGPPAAPAADADDAVGFTSPAAMEGRPRETLIVADSPADALSAPTPVEPEAEPTPQWAVETPAAARPAFGRSVSPPEPIEGAMWAYTIYALILFAVPTLGVSAIIGIVAVTGRAAPEDAVARSHYVFQQRTLWAAAVAALLGLILIVVNLGVFVLFVLAIWTLTRGAVGVMKLKAGRPIAEPQSWFL